jgi:hypothetical protein
MKQRAIGFGRLFSHGGRRQASVSRITDVIMRREVSVEQYKKKTLQRQGLNVQRFHHENSRREGGIG